MQAKELMAREPRAVGAEFFDALPHLGHEADGRGFEGVARQPRAGAEVPRDERV